MTFKYIKERLILWIHAIRAWFAPVIGSIKGHINHEELIRAIATGLASGGGITAFLFSAHTSVDAIFPDPADQSLIKALLGVAIGLLSLYGEVRRRMGHGKES